MKPHRLLCSLLILLCAPLLHAQDVPPEKLSYTFAEALALPRVKRELDPAIRLSFGPDLPADVVEGTPADSYHNRTVKLFDGCEVVIADLLGDLIKEARSKGYDAVVRIRLVVRGKPDDTATQIICNRSQAATSTELSASFAISKAKAREFAERENKPVALRPPQANAQYLPLAEVLESPDVRNALASRGMEISVGWFGTLDFFERSEPDTFRESVKVEADGAPAACRRAAAQSLQAMMREAAEKRFRYLVRVGSYLRDQRTPAEGDYECQVSRRFDSWPLMATVVLRGSFANPR
ncbi:hypothetical protein [Viridibacterium curvum]|uniref:Uncharacterized protein n=1 Tax=Viridibacterium curvum TaxID=1101404 RepID=A0ABP9QN21_9RHOO